ncbi:MAG TPA: PPOX class F420-dependent oxidoreductase [Conexibacter sp.]|nr:PPOX class F420-dependent oxidoreductase [Conexibacter sp.]
MAAKIDGRARELLEAKNFCVVGTLRRDGTAHQVPVWVDVEEDHVLLNSAVGRAWPTNAERDPRVSLLVDNMENPYEYVSIRGRVAEITQEGADAHIDKLAKKYLDKDSYPFRTPSEQRIIVRVEPEHVKMWGG